MESHSTEAGIYDDEEWLDILLRDHSGHHLPSATLTEMINCPYEIHGDAYDYHKFEGPFRLTLPDGEEIEVLPTPAEFDEMYGRYLDAMALSPF